MGRVAIYECWCCEGRIAMPLLPGRRGPNLLACRGFCWRCGGTCVSEAKRTGIEPCVEVRPAASPA